MNRLTLSLVLLTIFLSENAIGQPLTNVKSGGYTSLEEFKIGTPKYEDSFIIHKRTIADIKAWGGNDYKVESTNSQITKDIIKREIWGIFQDDTLYLNGIPITGLFGYSQVEVIGPYSFLKPAYPANRQIQKKLGLDNKQLGNMFGAVGGAIQGAQLAVQRVPLVLVLENGEQMLLTKQNLSIILESYPDLKSQFEADQDSSNEETLLNYLQKINELKK